MRRLAIAFALSLTLGPSIGSAESAEIEFLAPVPCSVACPYWVGPLEDACLPGSLAMAASYDQIVLDIPQDANLIRFAIEPNVDYDLFACATEPDANGSRFIASGSAWDFCRIPPVTCGEQVTLTAEPYRGRSMVFRAYNWSDGPTCRGTYEIT